MEHLALAIVRTVARQTHPHELRERERTGIKCGVDVGDARRVERNRAKYLRRRYRNDHPQENNGNRHTKRLVVMGRLWSLSTGRGRHFIATPLTLLPSARHRDTTITGHPEDIRGGPAVCANSDGIKTASPVSSAV